MKREIVWKLLAPALDEVSNGVTLADAHDPEQPLVFVNRAFERVTGYSAAESLGKNCRFLQGPGTDPKAIEAIRTAVRRGEPCQVCLRNYRKDGAAFLNELKILPLAGETGAVDYFIGIQNDVTAQLLARALRDRIGSEASVAANLPNALSELTLEFDSPFTAPEGSFGVMVANHRGQVLYANHSVSKALGVPAASLRSDTVFDHFDADWFSAAMQPDGQSEHEWLTVRLCGPAARVPRADLSTYRIVPDLSSRPFFVLLMRDASLRAPDTDR